MFNIPDMEVRAIRLTLPVPVSNQMRYRWRPLGPPPHPLALPTDKYERRILPVEIRWRNKWRRLYAVRLTNTYGHVFADVFVPKGRHRTIEYSVSPEMREYIFDLMTKNGFDQ